MERTLKLTNSRWSYGSYIRNQFRLDIIYNVIQYKEMNALYNRNLGKMGVHDEMAEQMVRDYLITSDEKKAYEDCVIHVFEPLSRFDNACIEDLYGALHQQRKKCFGIDLIEKEQRLMAQREIEFDPTRGIDQTKKKEAMMASCKSVVFALTDPALFFLMKRDMEEAIELGKNLYIVVGRER